MGRRKRSLNHQELLDSSNVSVPIPRKVGMSAHGGLEYHRSVSTSLGLVLGFWRRSLTTDYALCLTNLTIASVEKLLALSIVSFG